MASQLECRCGIMTLRDGKLTPDTRKGVIRVHQDDAGLTHFCWYERNAIGTPGAEPEIDIVVIPGECSFRKIPRPGSRVFELRFPEELHRNLFFWAQGADADLDDDLVVALNAALNEADAEEDAGEGAEAMEAEAAAAATPAPASAPLPAAAAGAGGDPLAAISGADLAAVLSSIMGGGGKGAGAAAAGTWRDAREHLDPGPSLSDVLRPELVAPLLREPEMAARLAPYLPEEQRSPAAIAQLVSTPQFRHQLDLLSHALMTGQLDTAQFGLPPGGFGVLGFLESIQAQADTRQAAAATSVDGQQRQQGGTGSGMGGDGGHAP